MKIGEIVQGHMDFEPYINWFCESFSEVNGVCVKPFKLRTDPTRPCEVDTDCMSEPIDLGESVITVNS
ncbi:MAG: hypothetical protein V2I33_24880, partial [Kangiellaceae bacterium]|nr:hypothetical protein [Kangiellaceae bacterium]